MTDSHTGNHFILHFLFRGPRPLRRGGFHGQDRASGHPSAALQPALHARRHGGLLLRLAGPLDGLCHAVRHRTLLQRLLPGPSAAHVARHASPQRTSGEDVRHLPGVPVVGPDHGRSHRRRRQFEGARGRRRRPNQTRRSVPRAQVRLGGRHHLRRPPFARRPHGADLRPLQQRQDHLGQAAGHPAGRAGTEPRADLARRLLRRPREDPARRRRQLRLRGARSHRPGAFQRPPGAPDPAARASTSRATTSSRDAARGTTRR